MENQILKQNRYNFVLNAAKNFLGEDVDKCLYSDIYKEDDDINKSFHSLVEEVLKTKLISEDIDTFIHKYGRKISISFVENILSQFVFDYLFNKINVLSNMSYKNSIVGKRAFYKRAKNTIILSTNTFLRKNYHLTERSYVAYIKSSINTLFSIIKSEDQVKTTVYYCPACKDLSPSFSTKNLVFKEDNLYRCKYCQSSIDDLYSNLCFEDNKTTKFKILSEIILRKAFTLHSSTGIKCPDCKKFVPFSIIRDNKLSCPYMDCFFYGDVSNETRMQHPAIRVDSYNCNFSLNEKSNDNSSSEYQDDIKSSDSSDSEFDVSKDFLQKKKLLELIINEQINKVKRTGWKGTLKQKMLMYESYKSLINSSPEDMIPYLFDGKRNVESPIQARLFQEYCRKMQDALPLTIEKSNKEIEIVSLFDKNLVLFDGISEFEAEIKDDFTIPNNTKEVYVGGKEFKNYGPCFIGMLKDVIDVESGKSLFEDVAEYSFSKIKMKKNTIPKTKVKVIHYRIPSHYEMGSLIHLRRIRKTIFNKVQLLRNQYL